MALYNNPLSTIRHLLSSQVGDLILSTPSTATGGTTAVDTLLRKGDDYYNEHHYRAYCYEGTAIGQEREVSDWVNSTSTVSFAPTFSPVLTTGDKLEFHHIFTEDEYRKAINMAIESMADKYLVNLKDETTITLVADTYEYALPTTLLYLERIITEEEAGGGVFEAGAEIDPRDWDIIRAYPAKLKLHEGRYSITAGKDLRLEGQGSQAIVTADTDAICLPPDWLVQKAITFLPKIKILSNNLESTYQQALLLSAKEPRSWPDPRSKRIVE